MLASGYGQARLAFRMEVFASGCLRHSSCHSCPNEQGVDPARYLLGKAEETQTVKVMPREPVLVPIDRNHRFMVPISDRECCDRRHFQVHFLGGAFTPSGQCGSL